MSRPSERYVLVQRFYTLLDEWLFYIVLIMLLFASYYESTYFLWFGIPVVIYGAICIYYSYVRLWELEKKMLDDETP